MSKTNSQKNKKKESTKSKKSAADKSATIPPIKFIWGVVIAIIAFALYSNSINHEYALDDSGAIYDNRYVLEGFSGIPKLMKVDFWHFQNTHLGYYRPLSLITFAIENEFTKNNPHLSHFINVLIFALSCFVLFIVLNKLFHNYITVFPFLIALLFAAHPIHTEVIANLKGRDELLSFLNVITMIWFYLKYIDTKKITALIMSLLFCYLGMLSKETALTGVLILPLFIYYYSDLSIVDCVKKTLLPLAVVSLVYFQKKYFLGTLSGTIPNDIVNYPYSEMAVKLPTTFFLFLFSLKMLFFPHPLRYDYSYNQIPAVYFDNLWVYLGMALFAGGAYITYRLVFKKSVLGFALGAFFITLIPALAFTLLRGGIFAERLLFAPSLGFCIAIVFGIAQLTNSTITTKTASALAFLKTNAKLYIPVLLIFALYSFKTVHRNTAWKDDITLYRTDIKTGENSTQNQRHLAMYIINASNAEKDSLKKIELATEAKGILKQALHIYPKFAEADYLLGYLYLYITPQFDSAIYFYNKAINESRNYALAQYDLGQTYQSIGKYDLASFYYNEAILSNPQMLEPKVAAEKLRKLGIDVRVNPLSGQPKLPITIPK